MTLSRKLPRAVTLSLGWMVFWWGSWNMLTQPAPDVRTELPKNSHLVSVSDSGRAAVFTDWIFPIKVPCSRTRIWNVNTGQEVPGPLRLGDVPLVDELSYDTPMFVRREGAVHQIDAISGDSLRRFNGLLDATKIEASPGGKHLLVLGTGQQYEVVDAQSEGLIYSIPMNWQASPRWLNDEYLVVWRQNPNGQIVIGVAMGRGIPITDQNFPLLIGDCGGRTLVIQLRSTPPGLIVIDADTKQEILVLSTTWAPDRGHLRFSEDKSAILLDYLGQQGRIETARWVIGDPPPPKVIDFKQFEVASNGYVLQWEDLLDASNAYNWYQELLYNINETMLPERILFTVFDKTGERIFRANHSVPEGQARRMTHAFVDGGQGVVLLDQTGLNYYRLPSGIERRPAFWLGLFGPVLLAWGVWKFRRRRADLITELGTGLRNTDLH